MFLPLLLAALTVPSLARAAISYSAATVVNAATGQPILAPNTFATIYGRDLAFTTRQLQPSDVQGGLLPVHLPGTGVRVWVDGIAAAIWYVSPTQVNFLVPQNLLPGRDARLWLTLDGRAGPEVLVRLAPVSPGLFLLDPETVVAARLDGSVLTRDAPARPGQDIVLFATGLGPTAPETPYREIATSAAPLVDLPRFQITLDDQPVPPENIRYAGAAPRFAGVYQINLLLPSGLPPNPRIRIAAGGAWSPEGTRLPATAAP